MNKRAAVRLLLLLSVLFLVSQAETRRSHAGIASADLSVTKVDSPDPVNAGSNLNYTITVTNNGPDAATNSSWSDALPAATTFTALSGPEGWSCITPETGDSGTVSCSNPSFGVGSAVFTLTVAVAPTVPAGTTISNTATATSGTPDGNSNNNSGTAITTVLSPANVKGIKSHSGGTTPGSTVSYLIILSNNSNSDQQDNPGDEFTDVLPSGLTLVSASASGGTAIANIGTNTVTWNGVVPAGDTITITIDATIKAGTEELTISNQGTISYDADGNGTNEASTSTNVDGFSVGPAGQNADLGVTKTAPDTAPSDSVINYVITVVNGGPDTATSATLTDVLPGDLTFVSLSQPAGWTCTTPAVGSGGTVTCSLDLPAGSGLQVFNLVSHIPSETPVGTFYNNTATVTSTATDSNSENDVATAGTAVLAATTTTVTSSQNPSNLNQSVTFTATVSSTAGTPIGTVQFKDDGTDLGEPQPLNGSGVATFTTSSLVAGVHTIAADYSGDSNFLASRGTLTQQVGSIIRFSASSYNTTEGSGFATITVQRIGDLSQAVSVDYSTPDDSSATTVLPCSTANGAASPRCDFEAALGTLQFAAGDGAAKTFIVLINQDSFVEGPETLTLTLSNLTGSAGFEAAGATTSSATLTIADDVTEPTTNPIDDTDNFVRQHYRDFLNREPDAAGLAFWKDNIDKCNDPARRPAGLTVAQCIELFRIHTSAAFFLSIEFQNTGYYVERVYKTAVGDISPPTVPVPVRFTNFLRDTQQIGAGVIVGEGDWQAQLDNNKSAFALSFVQRGEFLSRYPGSTTATEFVDSLNANAGSVLSDSERSALITELTPNPADPTLRASVLRKIADNATLQQQEFNRAFVLMEYFGYLRRNPDAAPEQGLNFDGYNFWLNKLNQFNSNFIIAEMVKAFLSSDEYRHRFGP